MKINDIKERTSEDLEKLIVELRKEYVMLVFSLRKSESKDVSRLSKIRKFVARVMTVLSERRRRVC